MKTFEQFDEYELVIGNIYGFADKSIYGIYIGSSRQTYSNITFIDVSKYFGIDRGYPYCIIDAYGNTKISRTNMNKNIKEFIIEDPSRYEYIKNAKCSIGNYARELHKKFMEDLDKDEDLETIIDSHEIGLL